MFHIIVGKGLVHDFGNISSLFRQCSAAHRTLITQQYKSRQTDTHTYESEDILHNYNYSYYQLAMSERKIKTDQHISRNELNCQQTSSFYLQQV